MAWILITQDDEFLRLGFWGVKKAVFKHMRGCCNIEMCKLYLDETMYRARYPSDVSFTIFKYVILVEFLLNFTRAFYMNFFH